MEIFVGLLVLSVVLLIGLMVVVLVILSKLFREHQRNTITLMDRLTSTSQFQVDQMTTDHRSSLTVLSQSLAAVSEQSTAQQRLWSQQLDKLSGLLGTKDPISFQQVQAMSPTSGYDDPSVTDYDPSDTGELARLAKREHTDVPEAPNGTDAAILGDLHGDPFFD